MGWLGRNRGRSFLVSWARKASSNASSCEHHAVGLRGVTLDFRDELVLVGGAGLEPAVALKHLVHDSSQRK
jgi:hypothetical protein